jgi:anti-anti-sigma factor
VKLRSEQAPGATVAIPEGRLDFAAAASFQQQLEALKSSGPPRALVVDCSALEYVSSAGLRVFLLAAKAAKQAGGSLALCALQPAVREVFELSGFDRIVALHPDRATALAQVAPAPPAREVRMTVPGESAQLPRLVHFLQDFWASAGLSAERALPFELALEEVFMNIVMHASVPGRATPVEVRLQLTDASLAMTIEDEGPAFDPLSLPSPDVAAELHARPLGGQGVHLVRSVMDAVTYERAGPRNRLRMIRKLG